MNAAVWDSKYAHERFAYGKHPNVFVREACTRHLPARPLTVAELASGEGRNAVYLAKLGHQVHAVDFSSAGLDKTRKLATEQGIDPNLIICHCSDVTTWQPPEGPGSLDAVIASFCHIPPEYKQQHYNNVRAMLKPGGLYIHESFRPDQVAKGYKSGGPPNPALMFDLEELRRYLSNEEGQELEGCELDYVLDEGPLHQGMGAVVRYVWQKKQV